MTLPNRLRPVPQPPVPNPPMAPTFTHLQSLQRTGEGQTFKNAKEEQELKRRKEQGEELARQTIDAFSQPISETFNPYEW